MNRIFRTIVLTLALVYACKVIVAQPTFENVAQEVGINATYSIYPILAGGISVRDFNQDGWDDIVFASDELQYLRFFENEYGIFKEVNPIAGIPIDQNYCAWIDYDNDDDLDLFMVTELYGVHLFRSESNIGYTEVTAQSGLDSMYFEHRESALFADFNNDGLLDLFLSSWTPTLKNRLYFQDSNHYFNNISESSGACDSSRFTFVGVAIDYNNDGLMDIYESNDFSGGNMLHRNNGDSTFTDVSVESGTDQSLDAMGVAIGDFDGDLDLDIHITDRYFQSRLLKNNNDGTYSEIGIERGVNYLDGYGWGTNFFDADLDGDEDLYVSGIQQPFSPEAPSVLYVNDGSGYFTSDTLPNDSLFSFSNAILDFNNDRLYDIATTNAYFNHSVWQNTTPVNVSRISVLLKGCTSNRDAFGSKIIAYDGSSSRLYSTHSSQSFNAQNNNRKIIPILSGSTLDSLKVLWPSGGVSVIQNIQGNQTLLIEECGVNPDPYAVIKVEDYAENRLILCPSDTITLTVDGSYNSYSWSNGATTQSIQVTTPGTYDVTVTNQFGVSSGSTKAVTVTARNFPQYSATVADAGCFNNGSIILDPIEPNDYTYEWSNGSTADSLPDLVPGTYFLTTTNDGFCPRIDSFTIVGPDSLNPLQVAIQTLEPIPCFGEAATLSASASGGASDYSYAWSSGDNGEEVELTAGTYQLTVTDSLGCIIDTAFTIGQPTELFVWAESMPDTNFSGVGIAWVEIDGGTSPYDIQWYDSLLQTTDTAYYLKADTYLVEVLDFNACLYSREIRVRNRTVLGASTESLKTAIQCLNQGEQIEVVLPDEQSVTSVNLIDLHGRLLSVGTTHQTGNRISIDKAPKGVYIIRINDEPACKVIKL